jgi:ATP-binding cassette subfamily B multidrug efflux pump
MAEAATTTPSHQEEEAFGKAYDGRLMRRLLTYLRPYKWQAGVSLVAIFLKAGFDILGPYLIMVAVNLYFARASSWRPPFWARYLSTDAFTGVSQIAAVYLASLLLSLGLEFVQTYLMQWTGQNIMFDMRRQIFRHLQQLHIGFFDRNPVGRLVTRVTSDVDALNEMFTAGVLSIFEDVFVLIGIVAIMLRMKWWLALVAFSVLPLIMLATHFFRIHVRESYRRIRTAIARINAHTQEHVSGMSVVQLFNRERKAYESFEAVNRSHMVAFKDAILAYSLYYPAVEIISSVAIALIIWLGGEGVIRSLALPPGHFARFSVTIGVLIAFIQYSQRFFRPIQDLSEKYNILQSAMASSERIFKLLDTPVEIVSPSHPHPGDNSGRLEFRNVWFTYQRLDAATLETLRTLGTPPSHTANGKPIEWILRDVSFIIEPDETAAIVGHTGAGKTTLTALMMRFYDVQRGSVLVDGLDVREHDLTELRRRFGVVLQDPFLFTGTIAENIRLGSTWITDAQMRHAADEVNVSDFIDSLPGTYNYPVAERGSTFSTGQKQLINFARALAHNPRILILDEATSSVDTETELRVRSALVKMIAGRTSVVIAHRLSTVQRADRILVMHKGQLREIGTHQELLMQRGLYWKLYQLQYRDQELNEPDSGLEPELALGQD